VFDKRLTPEVKQKKLEGELLEAWRLFAESNQRSSKAAYRDFKTKFPHAPSYRTCMRYRPGNFELALSRHGEDAAKAYRPHVLTTRRGLWVGSHIMVDDVWHDHFVVDGTVIGRPMELGILDYASACYVMRGGKVRRDEQGGKAVLESETRLMLAAYLMRFGYSTKGTELVLENATATVRADTEEILARATNDLITVSRSTISSGRAKATSQWGKATGGNPRHKAALESFHNLLHNELANLPAQTGKDRDHRPEETAGLLKYQAGLLAAQQVIDPRQAAQIQHVLLTRGDWEQTINAIVARINMRTDHDLEGWDDYRTICPINFVERKMSPAEVFARGRGELKPLGENWVAEMLYADLAQPKRVKRRELRVLIEGVSHEPCHYDAHALALTEGEKYDVVANPFDAEKLWVYTARGAFLGTAPRLYKVCRADEEALHREMGRVEKIHSDLIAPFRRRHAAQTRERIALMEHNAEVLSGGELPAKPLKKSKREISQTNDEDFESLKPEPPLAAAPDEGDETEDEWVL
jgi:hypothetical protein